MGNIPLADMRQALGYSRERAADGMGVSVDTIDRWEAVPGDAIYSEYRRVNEKREAYRKWLEQQ